MMSEGKEKEKFVPLIDTVKSLVGGSTRVLFGANHPILEGLQARREERVKSRKGLQGLGLRSRTGEGSKANENIVPLRQSLAGRIKSREPGPIKLAIADRLRVVPANGSREDENEADKEQEEDTQPTDQRSKKSSYSGKTETRPARRAM